MPGRVIPRQIVPCHAKKLGGRGGSPPASISHAIFCAYAPCHFQILNYGRVILECKKTFGLACAEGASEVWIRVGKGASATYMSMSEHEVRAYMQFDIKHHNLCRVGRLILQQDQGVPTRGFLSAQPSELCAMWREMQWGFGPNHGGVETALHSAVYAQYPKQLTLSGESDLTLAHVLLH